MKFNLSLFYLFLSTSFSIPDLPYEEILSIRRPFQNQWLPNTLPTNWSALPCTSIISSAAINTDIGALILCKSEKSVFLFSLTLDAIFTWIGPSPSSSNLEMGTLVTTSNNENENNILFLILNSPQTLSNSLSVYTLDCNAQQLACNATLITLPLSPSYSTLSLPSITATTLYPSVTLQECMTLWIISNISSIAFDINLKTYTSQLLPGLPFLFGANAIAYSTRLNEIALGNDTKMVFFNASNISIGPLYFEWVTDVINGDGGVYDDIVTSLIYDDSSLEGILYVGTPTCLNIRFSNGLVTRISSHEGLPVGNITSLAMNYNGPNPRVWIGSNQGLILYDPSVLSFSSSSSSYLSSKQMHHSLSKQQTVLSQSSPSPPLQQKFRYFFGPRWLPASNPDDAFTGSAVSSIITSGSNTFIIASSGVAILQSINMTLLDKVRIYEGTISRHTRLGQISQCNFITFGVIEGCISGSDDNDGLWTSLTVIAESMRFILTNETEAKEFTTDHFQGMYLLMRATGIRGLISRSVVCPSCDTGEGGVWHNSTVKGLEGYKWKGDASSDEMDGHALAYPFVVKALYMIDPINASQAKVALLDLARYIVINGFKLIDITGQPTTWGHWEPSVLNYNRSDWSDTRGLNSLEILSLLVGALSLTDATDPDHLLFVNALSTLRSNGYFRNLINLKIEAPSDDNFSDDELAMFAYLSFAFSAKNVIEITQEDWKFYNLSLYRTYTVLRQERSALWNSFFSLCGIILVSETDIDSILWNLRTWQLESISWPVRNSHRLDIIIDKENSGRSGGTNDALFVLPANERSQGRWNSDPYNLDGGNGMSEDDPGAFLLSYWSARFAGILDAPTPSS